MANFNKEIKKVIANTIEYCSNYERISNWFKEDFKTKIQLKDKFSEMDMDDLQTMERNWVTSVLDDFVSQVYEDLGIKSDSKSKLAKLIREETAEKLYDEVELVTAVIMQAERFDIGKLRADIQFLCDGINACETLQDLLDFAKQNENRLGEIILSEFYSKAFYGYPDNIKEAIEDDFILQDLDFIRFEKLGEVDYPTIRFKNGKTNVDMICFDIFDRVSDERLFEDYTLSQFIDAMERERERCQLDEIDLDER